ncbi:hypothetical protein [Pseudomonas sp. GL-B-16]|uniref:hypothetical protein n=1 Tax=Pseudomonas sp. GL-B-16 TaxID=2832373 RepID=UPI001CBE0B86|nr:hypothetical protein [Pseudomonas sp. GL-B-16]
MDTLIQLGYERQAPIEAAKAAFLASGGRVRQCGLSETRPKAVSMWNSSITRRANARREFMTKEAELAKLIRDFAAVTTEFGTVRRTPIEVRNKLRAVGEKLTTPQVEQIAAKYRIELADGGSTR